MLARVLSLISVTLGVLALYFAITSQVLAGGADTPADTALVTGLRIVAGACAIAAISFGLVFLNLRDEAHMRGQRAAKESGAIEPIGEETTTRNVPGPPDKGGPSAHAAVRSCRRSQGVSATLP